jgi:hypothetical protein
MIYFNEFQLDTNKFFEYACLLNNIQFCHNKKAGYNLVQDLYYLYSIFLVCQHNQSVEIHSAFSEKFI